MNEKTMTLEEEKKLVAKKLMGWTVQPQGMGFTTPENRDYARSLHLNWNPQDDDEATCKEWVEIWEKMTGDLHSEYLFQVKYYGKVINQWQLHTALPSIRWKALIKTLE